MNPTTQHHGGVAGAPIFAILCVATCLSGCRALPADPPVRDVDVPELIDRYNARAAKITQAWSRAVVQIKWTDSKGKNHSEQGDGHLIVRKPAELALMVGTKVGDPWVVLGGDETRFWFFDLKPVKGEPTAAYFGHHTDLDEQGMAELGIPVRSDQFIQLLGIHELPAPDAGTALVPEKKSDYTHAWYKFPVTLSNESIEQRVLIHTPTATPRKIRFLDAAGQVIAEADLSGFEPMRIKDQPLGTHPELATRIEIHSPRVKARVTLHLSDLTPTKVTDAQFNIDALRRRYKPDKLMMLRPLEKP